MKVKTRPGADDNKSTAQLIKETRQNLDIIKQLNKSEGYENIQ